MDIRQTPGDPPGIGTIGWRYDDDSHCNECAAEHGAPEDQRSRIRSDEDITEPLHCGTCGTEIHPGERW